MASKTRAAEQAVPETPDPCAVHIGALRIERDGLDAARGGAQRDADQHAATGRLDIAAQYQAMADGRTRRLVAIDAELSRLGATVEGTAA